MNNPCTCSVKENCISYAIEVKSDYIKNKNKDNIKPREDILICCKCSQYSEFFETKNNDKCYTCNNRDTLNCKSCYNNICFDHGYAWNHALSYKYYYCLGCLKKL